MLWYALRPAFLPNMAHSIHTMQPVLEEELSALNTYLCQGSTSQSHLARGIFQHMLRHPGKKLRPMLVLLSALAHGYDGKKKQHIQLAAIVEWLHTATLLHDDVIDQGETRRHRITAHQLHGNTGSILSGDLLYAEAFKQLVQINHHDILTAIAEATALVIEGELLQLEHQGTITLSIASYQRIISQKTAALFAVSTQVGALIANAGPAECHAMHSFGQQFGMAYQILDDIRDYLGTSEQLGKAPLSDFREQKATLPLIYTMQHSPQTVSQQLTQWFQHGLPTTAQQLLRDYITAYGLKPSQQLAQQAIQQAQQALTSLHHSQYRQALSSLASDINSQLSRI